MSDRHPRRITGMSLALLGALSSAMGCDSRAEQSAIGAVGMQRAALVDGGAPVNREYAVFVVPDFGNLGPPARMHGSLAFDAKAGVSVLIGGVGDAVNGFADTWIYDGKWTKKCDFATCATQPSGRYMSSLAFVPDRGLVVAFGGVNATNDYLCDTWEWETATGTWTPKAQPSCDLSLPQARAGHAMAGFGSKAALFGGLVQTGGASVTPRSNDLLVWDGQTWARLCDDACIARSAALPAPRAFASLVHASLDRGEVLLLFGGSAQASSAVPANDVWEYDIASSRWTELCTSAACKSALPEPRTRQGAAYDPVRKRLLVHGGCDAPCETLTPGGAWEFDPEAERWAKVPEPIAPGLPPAKASFGIAFDAKRRRIVEFGGFAVTSIVGSTVEFFTRGAPCTSGDQCHTGLCAGSGVCAERCTASGATGQCVNGFACNDPCAGKCQSCARVPGVCTAVTSGEDDEPGAPAAQCTNGSVCIPGPSETAGECKFAAGQPCNTPAECASGFCSSLAPHVCVDATCNQPCQIPQGGLCVSRGRGAEPTGQGCGGLRCGEGGACLESCATNADCVPDHYCNASEGKCRPTKEPGESCNLATECKLPYCVDGVCCGSSCDGPCDECGKDGRCSQRLGGVQPLPGHSPCLGSGPCGGYCGGRTECIQPEQSTSCGAPRCFDSDHVLEAPLCDGNGQCAPRTSPASCGAYACDDASGECFRECDENSQCRRGAICRPAADGRGVCHDEDTDCDGPYSIRTQSGSIQSCLGYPCRAGACAFRDCSPGVPGACAPNYVCRARACVPLTEEGEDAGADSGASKEKGPPDGGAPGVSESSSCAMGRSGAAGSAGSLLTFVLGFVLSVRLRRAARVKRGEVPGGVRSDP